MYLDKVFEQHNIQSDFSKALATFYVFSCIEDCIYYCFDNRTVCIDEENTIVALCDGNDTLYARVMSFYKLVDLFTENEVIEKEVSKHVECSMDDFNKSLYDYMVENKLLIKLDDENCTMTDDDWNSIVEVFKDNKGVTS